MLFVYRKCLVFIAVFGESSHKKNETQKADIILHSEKIRQLQETVKFLENTFNHIKVGCILIPLFGWLLMRLHGVMHAWNFQFHDNV